MQTIFGSTPLPKSTMGQLKQQGGQIVPSTGQATGDWECVPCSTQTLTIDVQSKNLKEDWRGLEGAAVVQAAMQWEKCRVD
jgi:hypothetical protein